MKCLGWNGERKPQTAQLKTIKKYKTVSITTKEVQHEDYREKSPAQATEEQSSALEETRGQPGGHVIEN